MKYLYLLMPLISVLMAASIPANDGYELFGLGLSTVYLTWNIYAYQNSRAMLPPMNYKIDFSVKGDRTARTFLAGLCIVLYLLIVVVWVLGVD